MTPSSNMSGELAGKFALVTGASKGIGAGIATAFGRAGANVAVGYARDGQGAERVAGEIRAAGGQATTVQCDLARTADIEAMVAKVSRRPSLSLLHPSGSARAIRAI
jgi:3-oxoacyl-[acyl-carrier protein] reductase